MGAFGGQSADKNAPEMSVMVILLPSTVSAPPKAHSCVFLKARSCETSNANDQHCNITTTSNFGRVEATCSGDTSNKVTKEATAKAATAEAKAATAKAANAAPIYPRDRLDAHVEKATAAFKASISWADFVTSVRGKRDLHHGVSQGLRP